MGSSVSIDKKVQTVKKKVQYIGIKEPDEKLNPYMHYMIADLSRRNHMYKPAFDSYLTTMYSFKEEHAYMLEYSCYERMAEMKIHLENYERASEIYFGAAYLGIEIGHTSLNNGSATMCLNAFLCLLADGQHDKVLQGIKSKYEFDCGLDGSVRPVEPYISFGYHLRLIEAIVYSDSLKMYRYILDCYKLDYSNSEYRTKLVEKITSLQEERFKTCLIDEK